MSRRLARERAFLCIYLLEFDKEFDLDETYNYILNLEGEEITSSENLNDNDQKFMYQVLSGVVQNLERIDQEISSNTRKWSFSRLNKIDIAILRLAVYEILFMEDIQKSVSVNEAVELAKAYGSDESFSFINGLLRKVG
ncbi:MAG: transcription antitermination factor NusB [Clostridiales bacterium]|nr:transcription antitermination factor NusB [Clostridiales bacterium]